MVLDKMREGWIEGEREREREREREYKKIENIRELVKRNCDFQNKSLSIFFCIWQYVAN